MTRDELLDFAVEKVLTTDVFAAAHGEVWVRAQLNVASDEELQTYYNVNQPKHPKENI